MMQRARTAVNVCAKRIVVVSDFNHSKDDNSGPYLVVLAFSIAALASGAMML
jgi:hypothetical protein